MTDKSVIAYSSILPLARRAIIKLIAVTDFVTMAYDMPSLSLPSLSPPSPPLPPPLLPPPPLPLNSFTIPDNFDLFNLSTVF